MNNNFGLQDENEVKKVILYLTDLRNKIANQNNRDSITELKKCLNDNYVLNGTVKYEQELDRVLTDYQKIISDLDKLITELKNGIN